jgi:hypothetical protein
MKRFIMSFVLLALISFISGCGHRQIQLDRHSYVTNYTIGEINTAYIGQSIIKVKDYYVYGYQVSEITVLMATEDFTLTANVPTIFSSYNLKISGQKGQKYNLYYNTKVDGIQYDLIYPTDSDGRMNYGILIDDKGNIKNNTIYSGGIKTPTNFILQPSNVKLNKKVDKAHIDYGGNLLGDFNYELVYSGVNNVSMNISYREYTRENYARPAFYQSLTYQPNAKQIRFKDFVIEILEATNDKIVYKVLSDGLK